jgi:hypothetical protein
MSARPLNQKRSDDTPATPRGPQVRRGSPHEGEARKNLRKHPDAWVTGSRPMTAAQASYLKTLCEHAGEAFYARLTKAEASKRIQVLRSRRW